jgi:hypothetical protein
MNTVEKGALAEAIAVKEMIKRGYDILTPNTHAVPFDFVAHKDGELVKVQVKGKVPVKGKLRDIKLIRNPFQNTKGTKVPRPYTSKDFDIMLVVDLDTEIVYTIPFDEFEGKNMTLRLDAPKNGQVKGIRLAEDFLL